jgi:SAM-dependent methyltransferase
MTEFLSHEYWSRRYLEQSVGWDLGTIAPPIKSYVDKVKELSIRVLIPGCGYAHEGIYLVNKGFQYVHFLDFSPVPMDRVRKILPWLPQEQFHVQDFFEHQGAYDLIIEQTLFCAINPELREAYVKKIDELLVPGGSLIGVLFDRTFEGGPPYGGSREEYLKIFGSCFQHIKLEPCYNSATPRRGTELFIQLKK